MSTVHAARALVVGLLASLVVVTGPSGVAAAATAPCGRLTLHFGAGGPAVATLQRLLGERIDGDFGDRTRAAVKHAQSAHGLEADGVVGTRTWTAVRGCTGRPAASATSLAQLNSAVRRALRTRHNHVSVSVFDRRTGATYVYGATARYETASIVKVQILAALLQRARALGRGLTVWERGKAAHMIRESDNGATSALWHSLRGGVVVGRTTAAMGMRDTVVGPGGRWGLTMTTAGDQVLLMRNMAYSSDVLGSADRALVRTLMLHVVASQRWGITAGVPRRVGVQIKNGWLPRSTKGWRVNSIGHVSGQGRDYVIAVLTSGNGSWDYGIDSIEAVSRAVWRALAKPLE